MSDYRYNKQYKELVIQGESLEEEILKFLESLPASEEIVKKFVAFSEIQDKKIDIIDDELADLEWDKDNEVDEKEDEIRDLEKRVEELEDQLEDHGIGNSTTLEDEMKAELWQVVSKKFTLVQLEEKLGGNRFQLM